MTPTTIGALGLFVLVLLMLLRVPIYAAMTLVGFLGFSYVSSSGAALHLLSKDLYGMFSSYSLTVIPLFILMGDILSYTGTSQRLYYTVYKWIGHWPGGLAMATIAACTAFGAICGSQIATTATLGRVALPEMRKYKYSPAMATGCVAAGGILGGIIPPSINFIIYGIMAGVSIGKLFASGILPGLLIAAAWVITIRISIRINPSLAPVGDRATWKQRLTSLAGVSEAVILFALVMGGLFAGAFTPTEAGAVGAGGALIIGLITRKLTWQAFKDSILSTMKLSSMVLLILVGATVFTHFLTVSGIPAAVSNWVSVLSLPPSVTMLLFLLVFIFVGMWMDTLPVLIIAIPIMVPICNHYGFSLVWLGTFLTLSLSIGLITPPVGLTAYVTKGIAGDVPLEVIFKGTTPFTLAMIVVTIIVLFVPQIAVFLPNLLY